MNLQKRTLERYRQLFPNDTLKETSSRTGIQITRVFRLFNGKVMKVKELEAMEKAISEKISSNPNHDRLTRVLETAAALLTNEEMSSMIEWIERKNTARTFGRFYISSTYNNAHSA